jgi:hypothetical protein
MSAEYDSAEHTSAKTRRKSLIKLSAVTLVCCYPHAHPRTRASQREHFAADVVRMMNPNVTSIDVTRPSRDDGRDGIGKYRLGLFRRIA